MRDLVAVSAPTHPVGPRLRLLTSVLVPLYRVIGARGPVREAILDTLFTDRSRAQDPDGVAQVLDPLHRAPRPATARAIRTAILHRTDLAWAARQITCPVLLVTTDDRGEWTPEQAAAMAEQMVDARAVTISGSRGAPLDRAAGRPGGRADGVLGQHVAPPGRGIAPPPPGLTTA